MSDTYFSAPADFEYDYDGSDYGYANGLSAIFWGSVYQFTDFGDFYQADAFRFIGQQENDYNRWTAGDEINLFFLDYEHDEYADNAGFVLAGAVNLAVGSAVLLASAFLM